MRPSPPLSAIAMAMRDSVTVSMSDETMGMFKCNPSATLAEGLHLNIPIVSSDMDTVTESRMAIAMALNGGLGLIHYNMPAKDQVKEVARVKRHIHGFIQDPITVSPDFTIGNVLELVEQKNYGFLTFPVVDSTGKLVGLLPGSIVK